MLALKKMLCYNLTTKEEIMKASLLTDIFVDIKDWIFNWDTITFAITVTIISLLMAACAISFIKAILPKLDKKPKFKFLPVIFLGLLVAMLVIILKIRS